MLRPQRVSFAASKARALALLAASLVASPALAHDTGKPSLRFQGLRPGEFVTHQLKIPLRVVLIGFDSGVDDATVLGWLPASYKPLVRYPQFYGLDGRSLGLNYSFDARIVRKNRAFADRFFARLHALGQEGPLTLYQGLYNAQLGKIPGVDVTPTVLYIDGPSVESWLAKNEAPDDGYTVYFVNWYGRSDFRFHVYTKTDQPDPDTGYNFGQQRASRKMVAWGGTSSRTWFYDFSAGPEAWGGNYDVDDPDLDGDGVPDYRIPPIWEYSAAGYRPPADLSDDIGVLARFVAVDLLFTPSPLYDPLVTAPDPLGRKVAHVTMLEDNSDPAQKGVHFFDPGFALSQWRSFEPYYRWHVGTRNEDPIDDAAKRSYQIFSLNDVQDDCWNSFGDPFAELFCFFDANRSSYIPAYRKADYVAPVLAYNTTDDGLGAQFGLLGFADDNWTDGTQSFVFTFGAPGYRSLGYGFTSTTVHEVGHHIGMSHPHDGYDSELNLDFGAGGSLYFAQDGDESDTVMHYLDVSTGFGFHNRDNMYRWEAAGYLNWANALAGDLLASPKSWKAKAALEAADALAAAADRSLKSWDYLQAASSARAAYALLAGAAEEIGVASAKLAAARKALPDARVPKAGCRPRLFPQEQ